ncbi:tetratricopeptide repeat protein 39A isoform X7 [Prionailurus iriomotensis]
MCFNKTGWRHITIPICFAKKVNGPRFATYVFLKAAILSMLPEEDVVATKEDIVILFRQVESLKQRIAGKSIPTEKFAVRKSRRYSSSLPAPVKLVLPALEMMYVWNGFPIVSKRKDLSENLLVTVEKAEAALQNESLSDYSVDDECLVKLLKGCCLKNLQRPLQAELCFNHVIQSEKLLKYDHYLVPFTLFELAFLYKSQGEIDKAIKTLETASETTTKITPWSPDYTFEFRQLFTCGKKLPQIDQNTKDGIFPQHRHLL